MKFAYIFFLKDNDVTIDFNGYTSLSSLLWVLGNEFSTITIGAIIWVSASYHSKNSLSKKVFRIISVFTIASGFYFVCWTFLDSIFFTEMVEIVGSITMATIGTILYIGFISFLSKEINNVRELRTTIVDFFVELNNVHIWGFRKNFKKLELLDDYNIGQSLRKQINAELKIEREQIMENLDKSLQEKASKVSFK
ncbi:hypothetical protein DKG77_13420 [Flagellimonas aquimarina]|uniref:Uncharacterized protein n=1 Tax=Flagellimonas aquimarina TaxID=2201895 RepID=A0A316KXG3_9FLAO|nr:hypothetical protein [Allomuricauda koreensis]PWL37768.1 hypothetical protein DKG77_13420 [Allomuricauda koreensis]